MFAVRRWRVQLLAGAVMLAAGLAIGVMRPPPPTGEPHQTPPPEIEAFLAATFRDDRCVTATEADGLIRGELARLGYATWTVTWGNGVKPQGCVGYDYFDVNDVVLLPALSPDLRTALEAFREETFSDCFTERGAIDRLRSVLTRLGESEFEIRPGGPVGAPPERIDEVVEHVQAGCFIYSTTGFSETGDRIYWVAGPY